MAQKPILKKPEPLTAAIISYMKPGKERADAQCAGLRVRCLASGSFTHQQHEVAGRLAQQRKGELETDSQDFQSLTWLSRFGGVSTADGGGRPFPVQPPS